MGFTNAQSRLLQDASAWKSSGTTKTPFYDRDLNNFRLLFDLRVIEVGVIVTRASNLQAIFKSLGRVHNPYGKAVAEIRRRRRRWMPDPRLRNYLREICRGQRANCRTGEREWRPRQRVKILPYFQRTGTFRRCSLTRLGDSRTVPARLRRSIGGSAATSRCPSMR